MHIAVGISRYLLIFCHDKMMSTTLPLMLPKTLPHSASEASMAAFDASPAASPTSHRRSQSENDLQAMGRRRGDIEEEEALQAALALSSYQWSNSSRQRKAEGDKPYQAGDTDLELIVEETPSFFDILNDERE